jgi:hypothetical protein
LLVRSSLFWLLFLRLLLIDTISCRHIPILSRTTRLRRLFLPFPKMEMSKSAQSLPRTPRFLLNLRAKLRFLTNPWLPLKKKLNPRLRSPRSPFLPLFPRRNGKGVTQKALAPPSLAALPSRRLLQEALLPRDRNPSTPMTLRLSAHKLLCHFF